MQLQVGVLAAQMLFGGEKGIIMQSKYTCNSRKTVSYTTRSSFLRDVQSGSESAWFEFHRKYAGMIRHIGMKRQLTPEECDDLLVDVLVIFWKKLDNFIYEPDRGKFRTYLGRITNYAAYKIFRKSHRQALPLEEEIDLNYPEDVDGDYMDEWRDFILEKALDELKQNVGTDNYQIFYMSVFQKRSADEIAVVTRKSKNNIYVIRSRCLKKLKQLIAAYRQREEVLLRDHSHKIASENIEL